MDFFGNAANTYIRAWQNACHTYSLYPLATIKNDHVKTCA